MLNELWLVLSGLLVFIGLVASQGLLLVVGSLVIVVWLATKVWNRYAFRGVSHTRSLSRHRAFIGDSLDYTVTLSNEKVLPLIWVELQDPFPAGLELTGARLGGSGADGLRQHQITTSLLPYQKVSWKYTLSCTSRGYHRIGPVRVRTGDIFGFTAAETRFGPVEDILVYPRIVDLGQLILPWEHPLGEAKGRQPLYQDPTRFRGLRDYQPTDPMKRVHWNATARRSRLQTKLFEPVQSLAVLIALNAATGAHAWQGSNRRLFERAVTVAASVAQHTADRDYSFGLVSNAVAIYSGKGLSVPFGASPGQLNLVLEALARAGPYVVAPLVEVLRSVRDSLPPGTIAVIVTTVLTPDLAQEIAEFRARRYRVIVLYGGDGAPEIELPAVPVYHVGRALAALDADEPVLAG